MQWLKAIAVRDAPGRLAALDGLRGVSILLVIVGHLVGRRYQAHMPQLQGPSEAFALLGVDIFFVISGFIITRHALREKADYGTFSTTNFYIRRAFRILPAFWLFLFFTALFAQLSLIDQSPAGILLASGFLCNLPVGGCGWFVGHSWSLAYEEQFYILFPLVFVAIGARGKHFFAWLLIAMIVAPFLRMALHIQAGAWVTELIPSFVLICAGVTAAHYEQRLGEIIRGRFGGLLIAASLCVIAFAAALFSVRHAPGTSLSYVQRAVAVALIPAPIAFIVVAAARLEQGHLVDVLGCPQLVWIGRISFSLYLWQELFSAAPEFYLTSPPSLLFSPPAMLAFAIASFYLVELPTQRYGKRFRIDYLRPKLSA